MLKRLERAANFLEVTDRSIFLMRQYPIIQVQHATLALVFVREVDIVSDVNVDTVVIDWVQDFPVKRFLLSNSIMVGLLQATVGYCNQVVGHSYTGLHSTIRLVSTMIFVGPPDTCPDSLTGSNDEMLSEVDSSPGCGNQPLQVRGNNENTSADYSY